MTHIAGHLDICPLPLPQVGGSRAPGPLPSALCPLPPACSPQPLPGFSSLNPPKVQTETSLERQFEIQGLGILAFFSPESSLKAFLPPLPFTPSSHPDRDQREGCER